MSNNLVVGVVGAGPAGIATVGLLIQQGFQHITWIDPYFQGGELMHFWGVPANTRSVHLSFFANTLNIFSKHSEDSATSPDVFQHYETTETPNLDELRECLLRMTKIIRHYKQVEMLTDRAVQIKQQTNDQIRIKLLKNTDRVVDRVFMCIGAEPKKMNILPHVPRVDFYDLMSPFAIEKYDFREMVVDVYGSRNSALLALKNLMEMRDPPKLVRHFLNKQLVYAEYIDDFIRHNYTGLKGQAKQFGLQYQQGKFKGKIQTHNFSPNKVLEGADRIVQAIGFQPRKFKFTSKTGEQGYTIKDDSVYTKDGRLVPNIHMTGFVNPQQITDKEGEQMRAVGVSAFLDHSAAVIGQWQTKPRL